MQEKTQQWMLIHASLMLAVGISAWSKGDFSMLQAAAAFSFAIYYVLADLNRRDLLITRYNALITGRLLLVLFLPNLLAWSPLTGISAATFVFLLSILNGRLSRYLGQDSEVSERLSHEANAFFLLMLSLFFAQHGFAPRWLPLAGLLPYAYFLFGLLVSGEEALAVKASPVLFFTLLLMGTETAALWLSPCLKAPDFCSQPDALRFPSEVIAKGWETAVYLSALGLLYVYGKTAGRLLLHTSRPHVHARMFWMLFFLLSTLLTAPVLLATLSPDIPWGLWLSPTGEWLIWGIVLLILAPLPKFQKPLRILSAVFFVLLFVFQIYRALKLNASGEEALLFSKINSLRALPLLVSAPLILWMLGSMAAFWERLGEKLLLSKDKWAWGLLFALFLPFIAILASPAGQGKTYRWITPELLNSFHSANTTTDTPSEMPDDQQSKKQLQEEEGEDETPEQQNQ